MALVVALAQRRTLRAQHLAVQRMREPQSVSRHRDEPVQRLGCGQIERLTEGEQLQHPAFLVRHSGEMRLDQLDQPRRQGQRSVQPPDAVVRHPPRGEVHLPQQQHVSGASRPQPTGGTAVHHAAQHGFQHLGHLGRTKWCELDARQQLVLPEGHHRVRRALT
jgi:hypothetical protein